MIVGMHSQEAGDLDLSEVGIKLGPDSGKASGMFSLEACIMIMQLLWLAARRCWFGGGPIIWTLK